MDIIHVASELAPVAKTGGLGDVVHGLCKELVRVGHTVRIILPKYDTIPRSLLQNLQVHMRDLWSYDGPNCYHNTVWSAKVDGLDVLLLEPHHPGYLFSRGAVYGCPDDTDRFLYFSRAVTEFLFKSNLKPDVLHLHDWQTAAIPALQKEIYEPLGYSPLKTLLTLHNPEHQGKCSPEQLSKIGLRGYECLDSGKFRDPLNPALTNLLKGGIVYADLLNTVSPSYKKELLEPKGSFGLEEILLENQKKLSGILNGIDEDFWNPETDPYLKVPFPAHTPFTKEKWKLTKKNKALNKKELRSQLGLSDSKKPLFACVSRLVEQKSPLLIAHAFEYVLAKGAQCIILGSTYTKEMLSFFSSLQEKYNGKGEGVILLDYNEELSHRIYAGSDILLVPSLFEPCGLTQMIGLRYGSVPLVRKTGGLLDTVSNRNGFLFENPVKEELSSAIDFASDAFEADGDRWEELMQYGMSLDFSWKKAGAEYVDLYKKRPPFS